MYTSGSVQVTLTFDLEERNPSESGKYERDFHSRKMLTKTVYNCKILTVPGPDDQRKYERRSSKAHPKLSRFCQMS